MTTATLQDTELAGIIESYNGVTERLKQSHELLTREVGRLHEELHEKNRELARRERLAAIGEMAAGVAHEIRNPLGGIGLYASLLERDLAELPGKLDMAKRISEGVRNLEGIVGDILAFSRDAAPKCVVSPLSKIVDNALTQCAMAVEANRVHIDVDLRLTKRILFCDPSQCERALVNLILNAVDAAGKNGHVSLREGAHREADRFAAIVVEDDGPGVRDEDLHRVFDPFFTTKDTGTGLGLAIVHRLAEANGGSVAATNRREGGAAFVLLLPLANVSEDSVVHV